MCRRPAVFRSVFAEQQPDRSFRLREAGLESEQADDLCLLQPPRVFENEVLGMVVDGEALVRPPEPQSG